MHKHVNLMTILMLRLNKFIVTCRTKIVYNALDIEINVVKSSCASKFRKFEPLSKAGLKVIIESMPPKTCDLDPVPTSILKKCINLLLPAIHHNYCSFIESGLFSRCSQKSLCYSFD